MFLSEKKIGPDQAKIMLASNKNRPIRPRYVAQLARDMLAGEWRDYSVIKVASINEVDVLIDGQHRLSAIIQAGITSTFIVMSDLDLEDQRNTDTGIKRTLSDTLSMMGKQNASVLSGAAGWLWRRKRKIYTGNAAPTISEGLAIVKDNPGLETSITFTHGACRHLKISHGLGACLHYEMSAISSEAADDFWNKLDTGLNIHARHPIYLLRSRLEDNAVSSVSKLDRYMVAALIIKAWNSYMSGEEMGVLRWTRGGPTPSPFPEMTGLP
jgi:hypothetical protein